MTVTGAVVSAHAKVDGVTDRLSTAVQLSFELLSTSEATIEPLPEASRYTVKSCAATLGFVVSCTVTSCVCEMAFEQPSVAVQVRIKKLLSGHAPGVLVSTKVAVRAPSQPSILERVGGK